MKEIDKFMASLDVKPAEWQLRVMRAIAAGEKVYFGGRLCGRRSVSNWLKQYQEYCMNPPPKMLYRVEWLDKVVLLTHVKPESVPGKDGCISVTEYTVSKVERKYKIKSKGKYNVGFNGGCVAYSFESPISCPREFNQYLEQIGGNPVEIDGELFNAIGLECFCLGSPIRVGEVVSFMVQNEKIDGG